MKSQRKDSYSLFNTQDVQKKLSDLLQDHSFQKHKASLRNPVPLVRKTSMAISNPFGMAFSPRISFSRFSENRSARDSIDNLRDKEPLRRAPSKNKLITIDLFD